MLSRQITLKSIRGLVALVGVATAVALAVRAAVRAAVSLVVVSLVVVTAMSVTAIRLDLDGVGVDDVVDLLVAGGFGVVTDVVSVQVALGVVSFASLVLSVVVVIIIVLHAPIKVVVRCVLKKINWK